MKSHDVHREIQTKRIGNMIPVKKKHLQAWCRISLETFRVRTAKAVFSPACGLQPKKKVFLNSPNAILWMDQHDGKMSRVWSRHQIFFFVCRQLPSAMTLIDSERAFQKRCDELHERLFEKLKGPSIDSFSTFAFSLGSLQNQVGETEFTQLADAVFETQWRLAQRQCSVGCTLNHAPCSWQRWKLNQNVQMHRNLLGSYRL